VLKRVHVKGFKCLRDVSVELEPFTVLIGPNDSGKSAFLRAISIPGRNLQKALQGRGDWVAAPGYLARLESEQATHLQQGGDRGSTAFEAGPPDPQGPPGRHALQAPHEVAQWLASHRELQVTRAVRFDPEAISQPAPKELAQIDALIEGRGKGTAAYLASLALGDRDRFDAVEGAIREVTAGRIKSIVVMDVGNSTYALDLRLYDGTEVAASDISQGLVTFLGFLALVHRDPIPAVLLIEEPENGLHPLRLHELVTLLRSLNARGTQIILTTHSPDLLSSVQPHEVRVFRRPERNSPTEVHLLPKDFERRAMRETLGEIWASRGEEGLLDLAPNGLRPSVRAEPK